MSRPKASERRRLPGLQRRLEIARVAAELFAAEGFSVPTRKISDALGITQAALYKHFTSKEEIIEEVFRVRFLEEKPSDFQRLLNETDGTLSHRLSVAYESFFEGMTETSMKLFQRASHDGMEIAKRYSPHLDERILWPVLEHLRAEAGMPALKLLAPLKCERELALMLHSTIVFIGIRKFVYQIDFKGCEPELIRQHVQIWLDGSLVNVRKFHSEK